MSAGRLHADFVQSGRGRIFITARCAGAQSPGVLVVPPFAEEMNKSRRMVAELAMALAQRGVSTVIPDLWGTGDSEGEFGDATVEQWLTDVRRTLVWSAEQGIIIRSMLAIRFGSLLAAELARGGFVDVQRTVLWQPVIDGSRMIDQFLRLRIAAQMMSGGAKESVSGLRDALRTARIEVAGYELSAELVAGIDALKLSGSVGKCFGAADWIEVLRSTDTPVGAQSLRAIDALKASGCDVALHATTGDPFWMSTEIVTSSALVATSADALCKAA